MAVIKINVRKDNGAQGAVGQCNPVVDMDVIGMGKIQKLNPDGTILLSSKGDVGGSGIGTRPDECFIYEQEASGVGSWPSGVDCVSFNWRNKTVTTTVHA